ncbi:MAG: glutamate 5-kinase [Spirochaetaceae bacterium]
MMRDFSGVRRMVVKIGTNVLTTSDGLDEAYIGTMAEQIAGLVSGDRRVLVVSSGAIGMGARALGIEHRVSSITMRQACAAIGQPILMNSYRHAFGQRGIEVAQVLLTREVLDRRKSYVNLRNAVESLLSLGVVPIFNENDSISTEEIGTAFGDNDRLSALVASKVDAELLVMLTDIDALYDRDPRKHPDARPVRTVEKLTEDVQNMAGKAGSRFATGGMQTKIAACAVAEKAGCEVVLAHGREPDVLPRLLGGEEIGTFFKAGTKLKNRTRWIMNAEPRGMISVDAGALEAIRNRNSLLPTGITGVEGVFEAGEVVALRCPGCIEGEIKLVSGLNSRDLERVVGKSSAEIEQAFGSSVREIVARPEDIVFMDSTE